MTNKIIDVEHALSRVGGELDDLYEIAEMVHDMIPDYMQKMRDALAGSKAEELSRHAHTVKGSASYFGAADFVAAAEVIEVSAGEGRLDGCGVAIDALEPHGANLREALAELIANR